MNKESHIISREFGKIPVEHGWLESQLTVSRPYIQEDHELPNLFSIRLQNELGIILCHPHPQMGGTMSNYVIQEIYRAFEAQNFTTLCFNFRGVGNSTGQYNNAKGEQMDVKASVDHLLTITPQLRQIILIGYSFGAVVSAPIAKNHSYVKAYIAISYPFGMFPDLEPELSFDKPKLFIYGDQDEFIPSSLFYSSFRQISEPKSHIVISGESHFWENGINPIIEGIFPWIKQQID